MSSTAVTLDLRGSGRTLKDQAGHGCSDPAEKVTVTSDLGILSNQTEPIQQEPTEPKNEDLEKD